MLLQARNEIKTIIDAQEKPNIPEVILDFRTSLDKDVRGGLISDSFGILKFKLGTLLFKIFGLYGVKWP